MTIDDLRTELQGLISERVSYKRNVANSIIIYFRGEPGDPEVASFFIDPTWRYEKNGQIVIGSYDYQIDESDFGSQEEYESVWCHRCELVEGLVGAELLRVEVGVMSADLTLEFSGGQVVRSFTKSAFDEDPWTYRNCPKGIKIIASPLGIQVIEEE